MNHTHKYKFLSMTTPCVVVLHHEQESVANTVANEIYEQTRALEKKFNFYSKDSWLTQTINERTADTVKLDLDTTNVLSQVRHISELTGGVFDVCVGTIKTHGKVDNELNAGKRTSEIAKIIQQKNMSREQLLNHFQSAMGLHAWQLDGNTLYFPHPMTRLDLGGVIKEYAVDKAVEVVRKHGLSGMISFGGDLSVVGVKPNGEPYRIGIKDPFNPQQSCMNLPVTDEALTTSGAYERTETIGDKQYNHIITPNTSENDESKKIEKKAEILSATVVTKSTLVSGMMSTALMINPDVALPAGCKVILINKNAEVKARQS